MLGVWHARIGPHGKLHTGLVRFLEACDVLIDRRLSLAHHVRPNPGTRPVLHNITDRGRGRNEISAAIEHELNAFVVQKVTMLDRIDAGFDRVLDRSRSMSVGATDFPGGTGLFDRRTHFVHGELWRADLRAGT